MKTAPSQQEARDIIQNVRKLVKDEQNKGLRCSTSDEFLLRFIRASHYNEQVSFDLIKRYFMAKVENPEAFVVQSPAGNLSMLQRMDLGLPLKDRDNSGRRVIHMKFGIFDPSKESWPSVVQTVMMILEAFSLEPDVQDLGIALILDCTHFSLKIMKWATPHKLKTILGFFQDCIPLRFEAVHIVNYPYLFNIFYSAMKPFMNEETKRKLVWHNRLSSIQEHISKSSLPKSLGGELDERESEGWYKMVLDREDIFSEFRKMGYYSKDYVDNDYCVDNEHCIDNENCSNGVV